MNPAMSSELADVARLEDIVDRQALGEVCLSFFELFALPIRVFSTDGTLLTDVHDEQAVCRYVNTFSSGRLACSGLVADVRRLDPSEGPIDHPCFTGASYRIVPILYQGRRLGRFVVGPYVPAERREVPRSLLVIDPGVDPETARDALGQMPRVRLETVERITAHLGKVLDLILFSGHRAFLTTEMHVASVRESYRALTEKAARLQDAYDQLRELDRLKSNFLATVSHELRTPLTSIIGYSDMLAAGVVGSLNEEQTAFVETIRGRGDHLLALITGLLDMNKLEQGKVSLARQPMQARDLLEDVARTILPSAIKKGVTVSAVCSDDVPPLLVDPVRIKQVLFNLVENALKFTPKGGSVRLAARRTELDAPDDGGGMGLVLMAPGRPAVELSVQDSGVGIPPHEHAKIFSAFYQVDGSATREHGGTGLGLAIAQRLVEAHGGTLTVESAPGEGATFRVVLPEQDGAA